MSNINRMGAAYEPGSNVSVNWVLFRQLFTTSAPQVCFFLILTLRCKMHNINYAFCLVGAQARNYSCNN